MSKLTGTVHGDAANNLMAFYQEKAAQLEQSGQYFMSAIALSFALETAILAYLLVEFGEDNGGELEIPSSVNMMELIETANDVDVLSAPIDIPSHTCEDGDETRPKHVAREVVDKIRAFRNLIHPGRALKEFFDPRSFNQERLQELKDIYDSVMHSLLYNI